MYSTLCNILWLLMFQCNYCNYFEGRFCQMCSESRSMHVARWLVDIHTHWHDAIQLECDTYRLSSEPLCWNWPLMPCLTSNYEGPEGGLVGLELTLLQCNMLQIWLVQRRYWLEPTVFTIAGRAVLIGVTGLDIHWPDVYPILNQRMSTSDGCPELGD